MPIPPAVRRMTASAVGALAVLAAVVLLAGPAAAHAMMTGTSPEAGATVTELDTVVLEFSEPVGFAQVQVTGPDGEPVEGGAPVEQGRTVELPLPPALEPGAYTVAFRVTSDDGHPIAETFAFAYEGAVEEVERVEGVEGVEQVEEVEEVEEGADAEGGSRDPEEARDPVAARDGDAGALVLVGVLVALLGFAAAAVFTARRQTDRATDEDEPDPRERDDVRT